MYAKTPCPKCNWKFEGFHVCIIDMRTPEGRKKATAPDGIYTRTSRGSRKGVKLPKRTAEHNENMSLALKEYWADRRESEKRKNRVRDEQIIKAYSEERIGMKGLAERHGINIKRVRLILHEAQENGLVTIRPRGKTIMWSKDD